MGSDRNNPMLNQWLVFLFVGSGMFLSTSGVSIANVALPFITDSFQSDIPSAQWILLGYLLATASTLINFGRLGDLLGQLRVHTVGFAVFALFSLLCAFSNSVEMLVTFRVLQAVGGAMIISNGPGIITSAFPPEQRGRAIGIQATLVGTALSIGPTLGGFLIGLFGWRSIFLVNIPVGIFGMVLSRFIKDSPREHHKINQFDPAYTDPINSPESRRGMGRNIKFDLPGSFLFFVSIALLVFSANRARQLEWSAPTVLVPLGLSLISSVAFVMTERRVANPMLDLRLFENRVFALAQMGNFLSHVSFFSVFFLIPFYLVRILQVSAEAVGLILLPLPLSMMIIGPVSGILSDRIGTKRLSVFAMIVFCIGLYTLTSLDEDSSVLGVALRLVLVGAGRAFYGPPNLAAIMGSVSRDRLGVSGGIYATMRHLGNIAGIALLVSYFNARHTLHLQRYSSTDPGQSLSDSPFLSAFHETFFLSILIGALGLILAAFQSHPRQPSSNRPILEVP